MKQQPTRQIITGITEHLRHEFEKAKAAMDKKPVPEKWFLVKQESAPGAARS